MSKKYIRYGRGGGHLIEHWACYVIPYVEYLLGRIAYCATCAQIALFNWHLRQAHGMTTASPIDHE